MPEVSNEVLAEKIDNLQQTMNQLKDSIKELDGDQRRSEIDAVRDHTRIENKADAANTRVDKLIVRVDKIDEELPTLIVAYRIMVGVGGALGFSVIALIWALITGQAHLTFNP